MFPNIIPSLILLISSVIIIASIAEDINLNSIIEKCPFGQKYQIECVDCFCDPHTGTSECSDEQCIYLESKCPNGTKFTIGCGNVCRYNESNGETNCMILRCRKKYIKLLNRFNNLDNSKFKSKTS